MDANSTTALDGPTYIPTYIPTEIYHFIVPCILDIERPESTAGGKWVTLLSLLKDAEGSRSIFWDTKLVDESAVVLFVQWKDWESCKQATESERITSALKALLKLSTWHESFNRYRVDLTVSLDKPLGKYRHTEVTYTFFPSDLVTWYKDKFEHCTRLYMENHDCSGYEEPEDVAYGWTIEDVPIEGNYDHPQRRGKGFVVLAGFHLLENNLDRDDYKEKTLNMMWADPEPFIRPVFLARDQFFIVSQKIQ